MRTICNHSIALFRALIALTTATTRAFICSLGRRFQRIFVPGVDITWTCSLDLDSMVGELSRLEDVIFDIALRARANLPLCGRVAAEWANLHVEDAIPGGLRPGPYVMSEVICLRQPFSTSGVSDFSSALPQYSEQVRGRLVNYAAISATGTSPIGLVVRLYETVIGDLGRSVVTIRDGDIERRTSESQPALAVMGPLQGSPDMSQGAIPAHNSTAFTTWLARVFSMPQSASRAKCWRK
jgi:flagellin-specific chaperone FliS